jgi:hypothetical protein
VPPTKDELVDGAVFLATGRRGHDSIAAGADLVGIITCLLFKNTGFTHVEYGCSGQPLLSGDFSPFEKDTRRSWNKRLRYHTTSTACVSVGDGLPRKRTFPCVHQWLFDTVRIHGTETRHFFPSLAVSLRELLHWNGFARS